MILSGISYKGYIPDIRLSGTENNRIITGRIAGISDVITFEAESLEEIGPKFYEAVDSYLNFCLLFNREPEHSTNEKESSISLNTCVFCEDRFDERNGEDR